MSFFGRLFKYRATEGKSPREDFLTEALAGVLESSLHLRAAFVKWLIEHDVETVSVETQKHVETETRMDEGESKRKLDLWLEAREGSGERHVVVFENKIGAPEGNRQLQSYERYLREHHAQAKSRTLLYLTPHTRSDFQPDEKLVVFRNLRWFQVFDWMKGWAQDPGTEVGPAALVKELLALMEDWSMDTNLSASDLAAAVAHRTKVEARLVEILNLVKSDCDFAGVEGKWSHDTQSLVYRSPRSDGGGEPYFQFGFDFHREEKGWSVSRSGLPSAYFAILRGPNKQDLPCGWVKVEPRDSWVASQPGNWYLVNDAATVKQLNFVKAQGDSLHEAYLGFFLKAIKEAKNLLG